MIHRQINHFVDIVKRDNCKYYELTQLNNK